MKQIQKLPETENACNSYVQGHNKCDKCLRNIGFYSMTHKKWGRYTLDLETEECEGYIKREK
jgi:hypothetical protein